jgi:uncharacterized protein (UPF0335 family)
MEDALHLGDNAARQLLSFIHRVEALEEEASEIATLKRELFAEIKAQGFDLDALKASVKRRKLIREKGEHEVKIREAMRDLYIEKTEKNLMDSEIEKEGF